MPRPARRAASPLAPLLLALLGLCGPAARPVLAQDVAPVGSARADHVVLVSIDGLRPEFYLDRTWPAPVLQELAGDGARALRVRSVFPSVTYPSHTSLVTGALPARHGVYYNEPFEPGAPTGRWYWEASAIKVPTLWDAVRAAGKESAALSWPVTVGAPIARNLPEVWSVDEGADQLAVIRGATTPGLWEELEREATGRISLERYGLETPERDDLTGAMAAYTLARYRPALLALHLVMVDHFQHEEGRDGPHVRRALAAADRAVGRIVEAVEQAGLGARTAVIVTGDHGFVDIHTTLCPNVWLVAAGLRDARPDGGAWRARFHGAGASAFLHLRDPADPDALARVRTALAGLPHGVRRLFRVVERDELERLGADPAAALALTPVPGVSIGGAAGGEAVRANEGGTHGYLCDFPEVHTGFVGWGPAFRKGAVVPIMAVEDVAPLVARLLGLDLKAPDGVVPMGVLVR